MQYCEFKVFIIKLHFLILYNIAEFTRAVVVNQL